MGRVTTEALALRRTPFGETSQVAEFLTRSHGRTGVILKGVHRPRARKGGGVDLLDHCVLTWFSRRDSRAMPQLVERKVLSHHPGLRRRVDLLQVGEWLVELLRQLTPEGQPVPRIFDLAVDTLTALEAGPDAHALGPIVLAAQGGILRLGGFEPVLDRCVVCERRPQAHRMLRCDPERGGIVCADCREGRDDSFLLSTTAAEGLRRLARTDPRRLEGVILPPELENDMRRASERLLVQVLERAPRCRLPLRERVA